MVFLEGVILYDSGIIKGPIQSVIMRLCRNTLDSSGLFGQIQSYLRFVSFQDASFSTLRKFLES